jgi:hypothetical protein
MAWVEAWVEAATARWNGAVVEWGCWEVYQWLLRCGVAWATAWAMAWVTALKSLKTGSKVETIKTR